MNRTSPIVRFAPSPTGRLHVGNIRTALFNWLFARRHGGRFVLRLDDTDRERSTEAFADGIFADLHWLGLEWDRLDRQTARSASYAAARDRLIATGRLYPCYETREELELRARLARTQHRPPVYDRAALRLSAADRARLESEGRRPHWRFRLELETTAWDDLVHGASHLDPASQSDPILVREDGSYPYTLPSVVDDIEMGISHVIRGDDHLTNTGTQIQIFQALDAEVPQFAHLPLLVDAGGAGLSKRTGAQSVAELRDEGLEPLAIAALLARLGTADPVEPVATVQALVDTVDLARVGRAPARFSRADLDQLNARIVHGLGWADVAARIRALDPRADEALWLAVRGNLMRVGDIAAWADTVHGPLAPAVDDEDRPFLAIALTALPAEPWDGATWSEWTGRLAASSGRKGRALFRPLRRALTGQEHGPEMARLLPLMRRAIVAARLEGKTA